MNYFFCPFKDKDDENEQIDSEEEDFIPSEGPEDQEIMEKQKIPKLKIKRPVTSEEFTREAKENFESLLGKDRKRSIDILFQNEDSCRTLVWNTTEKDIQTKIKSLAKQIETEGGMNQEETHSQEVEGLSNHLQEDEIDISTNQLEASSRKIEEEPDSHKRIDSEKEKLTTDQQKYKDEDIDLTVKLETIKKSKAKLTEQQDQLKASEDQIQEEIQKQLHAQSVKIKKGNEELQKQQGAFQEEQTNLKTEIENMKLERKKFDAEKEKFETEKVQWKLKREPKEKKKIFLMRTQL